MGDEVGSEKASWVVCIAWPRRELCLLPAKRETNQLITDNDGQEDVLAAVEAGAECGIWEALDFYFRASGFVSANQVRAK
jgi:hypothetical protein